MISTRNVAACALASLMALSSTLPAGAITDGAFTYSSPKTGYLALSTMAFTPDGSSTAANSWFNSWTNNSLSGNGCFNAGVNLPNGAKITSIRVMYSKGIFVNLVAVPRETGAGTVIATITRSHANSNRVGFTNTLADPVEVDNNTNQIGIGICVNTGESFNGVRINYTYTSAGD